MYGGVWTLLAVIQMAILITFYQLSFADAFADSSIFNLIFSLFGIAIWYVLKYNEPKKFRFINLIINHFTSATVIIIIWLYSGKGLLTLIKADNADYLLFLNDSMLWRIVSGIFLYLILVLVYYLIIYYNNIQVKLKNEIKLKEIIKESELNLLKSQINPHFLFNSLNSISSLTLTNAAKAQEMIIKLSDFLRYSITQPADRFSSLKDEIENINRYLEIEQVRFGNKLNYIYQINDVCFQKKVPMMILQPLYENAVKHGVYESTEQILIQTNCIFKDDSLIISISNNYENTAPLKKGAGIGLYNIRERLRLIYRNDNLIQLDKTETHFHVKLIIPQNI